MPTSRGSTPRGDNGSFSIAAGAHDAFVVQLLHRVREFDTRRSPLQTALESHLAARYASAEDVVRLEHQQQAASQASVANAITSLRLCTTVDWRQYVESVSLVDNVLRRDPAGVYSQMDFLSRDRMRQAVEEIAEPSGEAQIRVALKVVESARQAHSARSHVASHVGYYLIGGGRRGLELDLAFRPKPKLRMRRALHRHGTLAYLGSIYTRHRRPGRRGAVADRRCPARAADHHRAAVDRAAERDRDRGGAETRRPDLRPASAAQARAAQRRPRRLEDHRRDSDDADERGRRQRRWSITSR